MAGVFYKLLRLENTKARTPLKRHPRIDLCRLSGNDAQMSTLLKPLVARVRQYTLVELEAIAKAAGVARSLPRKLHTGECKNPCVLTIQPLIDYFDAVDQGRKKLPFCGARKSKKGKT